MRWSLLYPLLILNAFLLPVSALAILLLLSIFSPMWFITEFTIENRTSERILVTPVCKVGEEGRRALHPIYLLRMPSVPSIRNGEFALAPGTSRRVYSDWHDTDFSEIVVRGTDGVDRELIVNPEHRPQKVFTITDVGALARARAEVVAPVHEGVLRWRFYVIIVVGLGSIVSFVWLWRKYRAMNPARRRDRPLQSGTEPSRPLRV